MNDRIPLLELKDIAKNFGTQSDQFLQRMIRTLVRSQTPVNIQAVDTVNLKFNAGEVVGLVGESGCGKSTLGRIAAGLISPSRGNVYLNGIRTEDLPEKKRRILNLKIQMIFQDPYASLNPRLRINQIVGEAPLVHKLVTRSELDDYVCTQLERTGLDPALRFRFPHQFSGGQRQRVGIARALAAQPEMLVCDESVSALDVSIQAQILNLFMDLREKLNLTYLFISHDLGVVRHIADRIVIMYLGRVVEMADSADIFNHTNHPYTQILLSEIPQLANRHKIFTAIKGEIPSPLHPPAGCHFHPRCPQAMDRCKYEAPALKEIAVRHFSACHLNEQT